MAPVIFQEIKTTDDEFSLVEANQEQEAQVNPDEKHGLLVRKILETKKEMIETVPDEVGAVVSSKIPKKQVNILRDCIQGLCRVANPLGKSLDYIQEDVDGMNKEYALWKQEYKKYKVEFEKEQEITRQEEMIVEEEMKLVHEKIQEMRNQICQGKAAVYKNEVLIRGLIGAVVRR